MALSEAMHGHCNTADHLKKIRAIWSVNRNHITSKLCLFETERSLLRARGKAVDRLSSQSPLNTKPVSLVVGRTRKSFQHRYYLLSGHLGALFSVLIAMGDQCQGVLTIICNKFVTVNLGKAETTVVTTSS